MESLIIWPNPQKIKFIDGIFYLKRHGEIFLNDSRPDLLLFSATKLKNFLFDNLSYEWDLTASSTIPKELIVMTIQIHPEIVHYPQGYRLTINPSGIFLISNDLAGAFYGICTLIQIIEQNRLQIPCLEILDYPDFPVRGVMLDISRDRVPSMESLYELIDLLASFKINQFQLYTEHTYAYFNHPLVWSKASPITGDEILRLDAYCRLRFIDLVPNQNSFGHLHRWLKIPEYSHLAEVQGDFDAPWGNMKGPFSLCPEVPGSLQLLSDLYDELLPNFGSKLFNVGCDETFDLGHGGSKESCAKFGIGRVYLNFLLKIHHEVSKRGKIMQFWGDIILQHPELIAEMPGDAIALEWGYEADHPFAGEGKKFAESGITYYVCPGTSSWNSIAGRTRNAVENLRNAADQGLQYGAKGYLITDWGDNGHWQQTPISYLGYLAGAGYSWSLENSKNGDIQEILNRLVFKDTSNRIGDIVWKLGNTYLDYGETVPNASILFLALQTTGSQFLPTHNYQPDGIQTVLRIIEDSSASLKLAHIGAKDSYILRREIELTIRMLRHACLRLEFLYTGAKRYNLSNDLFEISEEFEDLWKKRSRPGGLEDSVNRMKAANRDYER